MAQGNRRTAHHPSKKGASRETTFLQAQHPKSNAGGLEPDTMTRHRTVRESKGGGEEKLGSLVTPY